MKKIASILIGLTLILGLFPSCGNKPKNTKAEQDYQRAARYFTADESFSPILNEALDVFLYNNVLDTLKAQYTNEQDAIKKLMKLETWLAFPHCIRRISNHRQQRKSRHLYHRQGL